ncbi:MAG: hypothetical protein KGL35_30905 [Bradyrhizobium sp.]|nr:hypothetical protein [Bradyrhizobium sp.]
MPPFRFPTILRAPDGDGGAPTPAPEPETFSKDYVRELRAENKGWRLKAQELEQAATRAKEEAEAAVAAARADAEKVSGEARSAADQRIIRAEVKAFAAKAGMIDLDGIKLLDLSALKLTEAGDVEGVEALIEAAKKAKPWLFGDAKTSATEPAPRKPDARDQPKSAKDMSDEEFDAAMRRRAWRN